MRSRTPVPAATFTPAIPDANRNVVAIGMGLLCKANGRFLGILPCGSSDEGFMATQGIGLDVSYQAELFESRSISGNINPTVNGTYHTTLHVASLNLRLLF